MVGRVDQRQTRRIAYLWQVIRLRDQQSMKTAKKEEMRKEYRRADLGVGVRGKYYKEFSKGTNLVLLSPDVAALFPMKTPSIPHCAAS